MRWALLLLIPEIFLTGCQTTKELPSSNFHFFLEQGSNEENLVWSSMAVMPISDLKINICSQPIFFATDIDLVRIAESNFGKCLIFQLTQRAAIEFYKLSVEGLGRKIVFVLNGKVLGLVLPISNAMEGTFAIFPEMDEGELDQLVADLNDAVKQLKKLKEG
jgi:hypothetical protein